MARGQGDTLRERADGESISPARPACCRVYDRTSSDTYRFVVTGVWCADRGTVIVSGYGHVAPAGSPAPYAYWFDRA
jgi:hypothetical protein